ncbi:MULTISPECIES: SDR family oxidoreductase [unclassified Mycobacterium]|uniref:SDR family oxidoreductase n=1 Tax=unclassified Mycobacterium TaxID=2642494 RepID=UPI0007FBC714|nr:MULTISPECIES: SDR family oxidoreductase [unclassified Mycobacterium]OBB48151.1 3-beta hydroxysteroid dehydrogenase [Mycobacterium sp. 852002-51961_SCH5331710]OBH00054.1 3-beta hydroxysteroid dehydrogenase [Mycobacterium sp. E136]
MRVFVTGASGHIGSLVVRELLDHGHQVSGLVRSDSGAVAVEQAGARPVRGTLDDLDVLANAAGESDGVIHLAFKHDFDDYGSAVEADVRAVKAIGTALAGSGKPFVNTSGTAVLASGSSSALATEETVPPAGAPRVPSEKASLELVDQGVRASIIRLAPTVHGPTDRHGFIPTLIENARKTGQAIYIGVGTNRWPAVHNVDAARLYRLAVESAPAGSRLHGAAEEGIPFRDIAEAIGKQLDVPAVSVTAEEALEQLAFIGLIASLDNPTSSTITRELLGWTPEQPSLLEDLNAGHYFA